MNLHTNTSLRFFTLALLFLLPLGQSFAQDGLPTRPFQLSFIPPLSTSGFNAGQYAHAFSINMIAGYHGGVNGIELGGVANIVKHNVNGLQIAGFSNIAGGRVNGMQMAGFMNLTGKGVAGSQYAGFMNISGNKVQGLQIAGFMNLAPKGVSGGQIAGFLNVTSKLKGVQIGVINIADTVERGAPIGVLSFVRRGGVKQLEAGISDLGMGTVSLRLGARKFYNIFSIGYRPVGEEFAWATGYGVGTYLGLSKRLDLNLEAVGYHLNEGTTWTNNLNEVYRAQGNVELALLPFLSIYGGVAWNTFVTNQRNENGEFVSDWFDSGVYDETFDRVRVAMRPGFQAGVRIGMR